MVVPSIDSVAVLVVGRGNECDVSFSEDGCVGLCVDCRLLSRAGGGPLVPAPWFLLTTTLLELRITNQLLLLYSILLLE